MAPQSASRHEADKLWRQPHGPTLSRAPASLGPALPTAPPTGEHADLRQADRLHTDLAPRDRITSAATRPLTHPCCFRRAFYVSFPATRPGCPPPSETAARAALPSCGAAAAALCPANQAAPSRPGPEQCSPAGVCQSSGISLSARRKCPAVEPMLPLVAARQPVSPAPLPTRPLRSSPVLSPVSPQCCRSCLSPLSQHARAPDPRFSASPPPPRSRFCGSSPPSRHHHPPPSPRCILAPTARPPGTRVPAGGPAARARRGRLGSPASSAKPQ